jgi:hypothetical protein
MGPLFFTAHYPQLLIYARIDYPFATFRAPINRRQKFSTDCFTPEFLRLSRKMKSKKILVFHRISALLRRRFIIEAEVSAAGRTSGEISADFI